MNTFSWSKLLLFTLFIIFSLTTAAQRLDSLTVDKLRQQAETCDSVGQKAISTLGGYYYFQKDAENLRYTTNREIECAKIHSDRRQLTSAYFHLILYHQAFSNGDSVVNAAEFLLTFLEKDTTTFSKKQKIRALIQLGGAYYYQYKDHEPAYRYFQQAKELALEIGDFNGYLEATRDLCRFYTLEGAYQKAIEIADDALAKIQSIEEKELNEFLLNGLKYNKARAMATNPLSDSLAIKEAYNVYKKHLSYLAKKDRKFSVKMTLTELLFAFKDYLPVDTLLAYGSQGIDLDKRYMGKSRDANLYKYHGKNLILAERYEAAQPVLDTALFFAKKRVKWYIAIADIYKAKMITNLRLGQTTQAEENFNLYRTYADSIQIAERKNELEMIETRYELSQKETENQLLKKESEALSVRSKFLTAIGTLLLFLLASGLYFYNIQRKNARKLAKLNETKNKIFTILAHDLKGPSLIFNNLTKKLSYLITKNKSDRLLELARHYEDSGAKISRTINNILEWAISEKETFANNPEKLVVLPMIKSALQVFEYDLQQKKIKIELDIAEDQIVLFDPNAFAIINRNLVHNAIKYAPINSVIKIQFNSQTKILEYIDGGVGFNQNKAEKILQRIPVKSEKGTRDETGTGIGLVTCVSLSAANSSKLSFLNLPEGGTKVSLQFVV